MFSGIQTHWIHRRDSLKSSVTTLRLAAAIEKGQQCGLERHELEPAEAVLKEALWDTWSWVLRSAFLGKIWKSNQKWCEKIYFFSCFLSKYLEVWFSVESWMLCRSLSLRICRRGSNKPENLSRKLSKSRFPHLLLKGCRHPEWVQGIPQNCASIALGHCSCQDVRALFQAVAESEAVGLEPEVLRGFGSVIQTGCDRFRNTGVESIHPAGIGWGKTCPRRRGSCSNQGAQQTYYVVICCQWFSIAMLLYVTGRWAQIGEESFVAPSCWAYVWSGTPCTRDRGPDPKLCVRVHASQCVSCSFIMRERDDIVTSCVVLRFEMQWKSSKNAQGYGGFDWKVRENIAFSTVAVGQELAAALEKAWFTKKSQLVFSSLWFLSSFEVTIWWFGRQHTQVTQEPFLFDRSKILKLLKSSVEHWLAMA